MTDQIVQGTIIPNEAFNRNRVQGYVHQAVARGVDARLDVPLISHVWTWENGASLWQGGCFDRVELPDGFNFVLSLYPWEKYVLPDGCERLEVEMYDSLEQGFEQVDALADLVADRLHDGEKVLVHCQAGCNRSGLLAAATLVKMGRAPADAIQLLRDNRSPLVLINKAFEDHILSLEVEAPKETLESLREGNE